MIQPSKTRFSTRAADWQQAPAEAIQGALNTAQETIEEYPAVAVMTAFAVGLSLGVGVTMLMACSAQPKQTNWTRGMW